MNKTPKDESFEDTAVVRTRAEPLESSEKERTEISEIPQERTEISNMRAAFMPSDPQPQPLDEEDTAPQGNPIMLSSAKSAKTVPIAPMRREPTLTPVSVQRELGRVKKAALAATRAFVLAAWGLAWRLLRPAANRVKGTMSAGWAALRKRRDARRLDRYSKGQDSFDRGRAKDWEKFSKGGVSSSYLQDLDD